MNCEVHIATCGSKTECEHRYHLEDDVSKVSAYTANKELNRFIMVTILSKGGNLFSGSEKLLSSFLMASHIISPYTHTHDVYGIHAILEYGAKSSSSLTVSIVTPPRAK